MWTSSSSSSSLNPNLPVQHVWDDDTIHPSGLRRSSAAAAGLILQDLFPQDPPALAARPQPPPLASVQGHFRSLLLHPIVPLGAHGGGKRRLPESETFSGDRSQKRMVNNRVSAARSRARKQAYTNELESQVALLREQNARLKKQQQHQVCKNASDERREEKKILHRTSSAPF